MEHIPGLVLQEVQKAFHEPPALPKDLFDITPGHGPYEDDLESEDVYTIPKNSTSETGRSSKTPDGQVVQESMPVFDVEPDVPTAVVSDFPSIEETELTPDAQLPEEDRPEFPVFKVESIPPPPAVRSISGMRSVESPGTKEYKNPLYQNTSNWIKEFVKGEAFQNLAENGNPDEFVEAMQAMHEEHERALEYPSVEAEREYLALKQQIQKALDQKVYFTPLQWGDRERHKEAVKQLRDIVDDPFICKLVILTLRTRNAPSASIAAHQLDEDFGAFKRQEQEFISRISDRAA